MAKDPAFLFYSSDFLSGCIDLDMEERGQYITMLCAQHQKGHLSEKTIRLLVGSVSVSVLSKFLQDENQLYFSPRLELEIEKRVKFTESRKNNGSLGGRPKKETYKKPSVEPLGYPTDNLIENENRNENIIGFEDKKEEPKTFQKPSESEIQNYLLTKYPDASIEGIKTFTTKFWSHYENNGWKVGKNKMKSWKLALAQWGETMQKLLYPNLPTKPIEVSQNHKNIEVFSQMLAALENPQTQIQDGINP